MKFVGKRTLCLLCTLAMLLSMMAVVASGESTAEAVSSSVLDTIPAGHVAVVRDYTAFPENAEQNTSYVADSDAYNGMAVCHKEDNVNINFARYDANCSVTEQSIGRLSETDLKINEGYQVHKFTFAVPADSTQGNLVFIMGSWQFQSNQLCYDLAAYAGKTVEVYLSMKVTGPADGLYSLYVDRVVIATTCSYADNNGVYSCSVCGKEADIIEALGATGHAYTQYVADTFLEGKVSDPDAYASSLTVTGAACDLTAKPLGFYIYAGGSDVLLDTIPNSEIKLNQGYQIYKMSATITSNMENAWGTYFYPSSGWIIINQNCIPTINEYVGKQVDIYVSMKVEGTLNNATCYVDRIVYADPCENNYVNDFCSVCGKAYSLTFYADDFNLPYSPTDSVVEDADSAYGKAAKLSYEARNATGDAGLVNSVIFGESESLELRNNSDQLLGSKPYATLTNNALKGTYVTYKFEDVNLTDANFMFLFSCWGFQVKLENYKSVLSGKTLNVYVSMKIEGDIGVAPTYYIDMVQISAEDREVDENDPIPVNMTFLADDFTLPYAPIDSFVDDAASAYGKAALLSYENRKGDSGLENSVLRIATQKLEMYNYYNETDTYVPIGTVSIGRMNHYSGDGYVDYTFRNVVPVPTDANCFMYLFSCWGFQVKLSAAQRTQLVGKTVDVTLSMKVEGNVSENPSYYIDCIKITEASGDVCAHGDTGVGLVSENEHGTECYLCGEVLSTENHTYDDGVVTLEPTVDAEGEKVYTCTACGYTITETLPKIVVPAKSWNLSLDGNIAMNFVLNVTAEEAATATVDVIVNGNTTTSNVADLQVGEQYLLEIELAAAQMNDAVTVALNKNGEVYSKDYSVRAYADYILDEANGYNDVTKNLVKAMLVYGGASQVCFNYNANALASDGISIESVVVPTEGGVYAVSGANDAVSYYGASLVYRNKVAVRFYFTGSSEGIEGATPKGDKFYIEVADISPQNLDNGFTVTVGELSVTYSPMDYIIRMYNKADVAENTKAIVQALYDYYLAAEAYIAA